MIGGEESSWSIEIDGSRLCTRGGREGATLAVRSATKLTHLQAQKKGGFGSAFTCLQSSATLILHTKGCSDNLTMEIRLREVREVITVGLLTCNSVVILKSLLPILVNILGRSSS